MKTMKLGRALVAVLLVCALLFSWSPVRAEAVTTGVMISMAAVSVIASILIAEAVMPGSNFDEFNALVDMVCDAAEGVGLIVDGMVDVLYENGYTYIPADLIGFTNDYIWSEGILSLDYGIPAEYASNTNLMAWVNIYSDNDYCVVFWGTSIVTCCYSPYPLVVTHNSDTGKNTCRVHFDDGSKASFYAPQYFLSSGSSNMGNLVESFSSTAPYSIMGTKATVEPSTTYDLTLGDVAEPGEDLATAYPNWSANCTQVQVDGSEAQTYYPISTPATYEEAITQTQTEAQSGTTSITDTDVAVGTLDGTLAETQAQTFVDVIAGYFANVVTAIKSIPDAIVTGITDTLTALFVPTEDYLTAKVEAIRAEFAFADSIISSGESIKGYLDSIGPEPPVIYINLDDFEGGYDIGGQVVFLDLRWYERYKPTGDAIISAFLWLVFAWRVFIHLPGLISGARGVVGFSISSANETGLSSSETGLRRYD